MERTEEEIVAQSGIKVILGGEEHFIKPLVIKYSGEWRKKAIPLISNLFSFAESKDPEVLQTAMQELFLEKTDEMLDCFFMYARDLDRKEIEEIATDGEVIVAFLEVYKAFVDPLSKAAEMKK